MQQPYLPIKYFLHSKEFPLCHRQPKNIEKLKLQRVHLHNSTTVMFELILVIWDMICMLKNKMSI